MTTQVSVPRKHIYVGLAAALAGVAFGVLPPHFEYALYAAMVVTGFCFGCVLSEVSTTVWLFVVGFLMGALLTAAFSVATQSVMLESLGTRATCEVIRTDSERHSGKTRTTWTIHHEVRCPNGARYSIATGHKHAHELGPAAIIYDPHGLVEASFRTDHQPGRKILWFFGAFVVSALAIFVAWRIGIRKSISATDPHNDQSQARPLATNE